MRFEPRIIEAKLALHRVYPEDFQELACAALGADLDGPAIRRLAALDQPSGWEIDQLLLPFMAQSNLASISAEEACLRLSMHLAKQLLRQGADPLPYAAQFASLTNQAHYPASTVDINLIEDDIWVMQWQEHKPEAEIRAWMVKRLQAFVEANSFIASSLPIDSNTDC